MKSKIVKTAPLFVVLFCVIVFLPSLTVAQPAYFLIDSLQQSRGHEPFFMTKESTSQSNQTIEQQVEQQKRRKPIVITRSTNRQVIAQADTRQPNDERMRKLEKQINDLQREIKDLKSQPPVSTPGEELELEEEEEYVSGDQSGNDPRGFDNKFMPYYRKTTLKNDLKMDEVTMFGMLAFNPRFAMTYEWPLAKQVDYSSVREWKTWKQLSSRQRRRLGGRLPGVSPRPGAGGNLPFSDLDEDGDETGMGDLNLRFFVMPEQWQWMWGKDKSKNFSLMPLAEFTLPTATEDVLGDGAFIASPGVVVVTDMPFDKPPLSLAFLALMNFYDFDTFKDSDRSHTSRFRGRWFYMQPLSPPEEEGWSIFSLKGLYVMTEMQPVYDFRTSDFSFWIAPEFGKIAKLGSVFYAKPGFGIDQERTDRQWTLEIGYRHFF